MNKKQFDEMQTQKINQIGNQSFILLVFLLMANTLLYSMGFQWAKYPMDIQVIIFMSIAYYEIRLALNNALISQKQMAKKPIMFFLIVYVIAMAFVVVLPRFVKPAATHASQWDFGSILLQVISWGSVIIVAIILFVNRHREDDNDK
jgi:hypothetical protein